MKDIAKVIMEIGNTSSYNDKLELLKKHADTPGLKEVLHFIYNPYCKTGISAAKLNKAMTMLTLEREVPLEKALQHFSRHQTGTDDDLAFARDFVSYCNRAYGADAMRLACAIVTQDLKIGITSTSLNKVYGADFIPKTGCMLGTLYEDVKPNQIKWPCIVTEKLDGVRRILVKENGVCRMYSRSGHEDTGLVDIIREARYLPDNYVYDGELLAAGEFKDCIAQRQATNSIANCKGEKTGLVFNVFDMIPVEEFYAGKSTQPAIERKTRLAATFMDESVQILVENWARLIAAFGMYEDLQYIKAVPILGLINNMHELEPIVAEVWERNGEGVMLNTVAGMYEIKRSKQLLKVKHTEEHVLPVADFLEGSGKYEDSLGALVLLYTNKQGHHSYVGVGTGFTDAERQHIWDNQEYYRGRLVEIDTFGESTNAHGLTSLNCPVFKRFVGEE